MSKIGKALEREREKRRTLASLKEENRILRAEIKRLGRTLRAYSASDVRKKRDAEKTREDKLFEASHKYALALASSSYFKYVLDRFSRASVYFLIKKIVSGFRKFKLVSTVIRIVSSALAILGTGAFFIFISGTVIFFIPFFLLICAAAYLSSMLFRKKAFRELDTFLEGKNVFVLFPGGKRPFEEGSCFRATLRRLLTEVKEESVVIIVSPFLISNKGFGGKGYFPVIRKESDGVIIIRRNAFFALRRRILRKRNDRTTYIF